MKGYADLADLPEDDRIQVIGDTAQRGHTVGFVVDDNEKADRYISKLEARGDVSILERGPAPIPGTILVKVGPKTAGNA